MLRDFKDKLEQDSDLFGKKRHAKNFNEIVDGQGYDRLVHILLCEDREKQKAQGLDKPQLTSKQKVKDARVKAYEILILLMRDEPERTSELFFNDRQVEVAGIVSKFIKEVCEHADGS